MCELVLRRRLVSDTDPSALPAHNTCLQNSIHPEVSLVVTTLEGEIFKPFCLFVCLSGGSEKPQMNTELEVTVRSLSVVLNQANYEVARAVMSQLSATIITQAGSGVTDTEASVGSLSLTDLTPVHGRLYREKFITAGLNMVMKKYEALVHSHVIYKFVNFSFISHFEFVLLSNDNFVY